MSELVFLLVRFCWRCSVMLSARLPTPLAGALAALLAAILYAAMAGFSVPTLRALIMLAAIADATLLRHHSWPWDMLGLALMGVLILNPLSAGDIGFWLSFGAVAAIFICIQRTFALTALKSHAVGANSMGCGHRFAAIAGIFLSSCHAGGAIGDYVVGAGIQSGGSTVGAHGRSIARYLALGRRTHAQDCHWHHVSERAVAGTSGRHTARARCYAGAFSRFRSSGGHRHTVVAAAQ